jgi:hypothetical protein
LETLGDQDVDLIAEVHADLIRNITEQQIAAL